MAIISPPKGVYVGETNEWPAIASLNRSQQVEADTKPAPLTLHIGGMVDPGGFLDFTSIFRSTNVGSGIGTSFGNFPFPNTTAGQLTECRFSAQNSTGIIHEKRQAAASAAAGR